MRKSKGPSTLPCGTPHKVFCFSDACEPICVVWTLFIKYEEKSSQNSSKIHDAKLRINRRAGQENVQLKPVIEATDFVKIRASPFRGVATPAGQLRRT